MITKKISLVVPLSSFDTEKKTAILSLRKGLDDMSETLESQHGYSGYELILACSFDFKEDTEELQDTWGNVVILNCKKKMGIIDPVKEGLSMVEGDIVIVLDVNNLVSIRTIKKMVLSVKRDSSLCVVASRERVRSIGDMRNKNWLHHLIKYAFAILSRATKLSHVQDYSSLTHGFSHRYAKVMSQRDATVIGLSQLERLMVHVSCGGLVVEVPGGFSNSLTQKPLSMREFLSEWHALKDVFAKYHDGFYKI